MDKKVSRLRRAKKARARIKDKGINRLTVFRTPRHIYAQVMASSGEVTMVSASTVDSALRSDLSNGGNIDAAAAVGKLLAERALANGIDIVAFDRAGFKYHGRVKALAEAAREAGLKF